MNNKNRIINKKLELLNSEGAILTATKGVELNYIITDQYGEEVENWDRFELLQFLSGEDIIKDSIGKVWFFLTADEGMKPSPEKIKEFLEPSQPSVEELKEILRWAYPHIVENIVRTEEQSESNRRCDLPLYQIEEILGLTFEEMKDAIPWDTHQKS